MLTWWFVVWVVTMVIRSIIAVYTAIPGSVLDVSNTTLGGAEGSTEATNSTETAPLSLWGWLKSIVVLLITGWLIRSLGLEAYQAGVLAQLLFSGLVFLFGMLGFGQINLRFFLVTLANIILLLLFSKNKNPTNPTPVINQQNGGGIPRRELGPIEERAIEVGLEELENPEGWQERVLVPPATPLEREALMLELRMHGFRHAEALDHLECLGEGSDSLSTTSTDVVSTHSF